MQEHIRRAHPEHYISKLPATEESFLLMINTPPSDRAQGQTSAGSPHTSRNIQGGVDSTKGYPHDRHGHAYLRDDSSAPGTPRNMDELSGVSMLPAASAAAALAQLGGQKIEPEWDSEVVHHLYYQLALRSIPANHYSKRDGTRTQTGGGSLGLQLSFRRYTTTTTLRATLTLL